MGINYINMEQKNIVSIWIGKFSSENELLEYTEIITPDSQDEPFTSLFFKEYELGYVDIDFQEISYQQRVESFEDLFRGISFSKSFIKEIKERNPNLKIKEYNAVIEILNYNCSSLIKKTDNTIFLGAFSYDDNSGEV